MTNAKYNITWSKIFAALNFCVKIGFLHFIFHEIQADDQKITLNMNIHNYTFTERKFHEIRENLVPRKFWTTVYNMFMIRTYELQLL